ncbi:MAG: hypothetical protein N2170_02425 [Bacteroidia bacterium]|nr:hypothetical protein [Bacteroidia bacterium]
MKKGVVFLLRFIAGLCIGLLLMLCVIAMGIYLSRERILQWVVHELSHTFSARISVKAIQVGRLQDLPMLSIRLDDFLMQSQTRDTLFHAQEVRLHLDLWEALVNKNYRIQGIALRSPTLFLSYDTRGDSPWKAVFRTDTGGASPWAIEKLLISTGKLRYEDKQIAFVLHLTVEKLQASLSHGREQWQIEGKAQGIIEELSSRKQSWLQSRPFILEGNLFQEKDWLLSQGLRLRLSGFATTLEGGVRLTEPYPELSLRFVGLNIDMETLRSFWTGAPPNLEKVSAALRGEGELVGPVGQGRLPRLQLHAILQTKQPFSIENYPVQILYTRGKLAWDPMHLSQSYLHIDTFFFQGGAQDTLIGKGRYSFSYGGWRGKIRGNIDLAALSPLRLIPVDSLSGMLRVDLQVERPRRKWELTGQGSLLNCTLGKGHIAAAHFQLTPTLLTLQHSRLHWGGTTLSSRFLQVENYSCLWDSTAPPLKVKGEVALPTYRYEASLDTTSPSLPPLDRVDLQVQVDSFIWRNQVIGPLRGDILWQAESLHVRLHKAENIAGGRLMGTLSRVKQPGGDTWKVQASFQQIALPRLHAEWPDLDSLFPLLPHLRGTASGQIQAEVPFRKGVLAWADLRAALTLTLRDFVVVESPYTYKLFSLIPLTDFKRIEVGKVETALRLSEGVVRMDTTWLQANRWRMQVAGSHTLRGELTYDLLVEVPRVVLDKSTERVQEWIEEAEGERIRLAIHVTGTSDNPTFRWKPAGRAISPSEQPPPPPNRKKRRISSSLPVDEK